MIAAGWSPSVRLFEAGACACPIISDRWAGIETVMDGIRLADTAEDVLRALSEDGAGEAARASVLARHTAEVRAAELEADLLALTEPA